MEAGFLRKKVSILIKSSLRLLIWSKLPTKVSTCDILLVNNSPICPKKVCVRFCWNICSSGIAYGFTLFCVFVPFVFKLWLSGSILHLSSNLVAVTPSYQLQTCATQKCLLIKLSLNKFECSQFWLISFDLIHVIKIWHSLRCCRNEGALCQQNFDNFRLCLIKMFKDFNNQESVEFMVVLRTNIISTGFAGRGRGRY